MVDFCEGQEGMVGSRRKVLVSPAFSANERNRKKLKNLLIFISFCNFLSLSGTIGENVI